MCNYTTASLITGLTMQRKCIISGLSGGRLKGDSGAVFLKGLLFCTFIVYFKKKFMCLSRECVALSNPQKTLFIETIISERTVCTEMVCVFQSNGDVVSEIKKMQIFLHYTWNSTRRFILTSEVLMSVRLAAVPLANAVCRRFLSSVFLKNEKSNPSWF